MTPPTASQLERPVVEAVDPGRRFDAILDAAEFEFANQGFKGASMRAIAQRANVAQALIHYHFETKEKLFEAMAARQANAINGRRAEILDELMDDPCLPSLEAVVEALFRPTIETGNRLAQGGGGYSRILVSVANSIDPRDQQLTERYYDPIAQKFISAFCTIEPRLNRQDAVWAYMFSIGVGMTMMARTGRSARLSDGQCDDSDIDAMLKEIVTFVCGGIRALVAQHALD
ncbi:MAG: TetR/AcrR family transcriptional regulator [Pseudomonadota bacterium]